MTRNLQVWLEDIIFAELVVLAICMLYYLFSRVDLCVGPP